MVFESEASDVIGVKEAIASYLEKYGDIRCVSVESMDEQTKLEG